MESLCEDNVEQTSYEWGAYGTAKRFRHGYATETLRIFFRNDARKVGYTACSLLQVYQQSSTHSTSALSLNLTLYTIDSPLFLLKTYSDESNILEEYISRE